MVAFIRLCIIKNIKNYKKLGIKNLNHSHSSLLFSFQILAAAYPKVRTIEFVLVFGRDKNLLLFLRSYLSEYDFSHFLEIFSGQFPAIALETYAIVFCCLHSERYFSSSVSVEYLLSVCHSYHP